MDETLYLYPKISSVNNFGDNGFSTRILQKKFKLRPIPPTNYYSNEHSDTISDESDSSDSSESSEDSESGYSEWEDEFPYEENVMILSRSYNFIERIVSDSDSVVYKAFSKRIKRNVIIKILNKEIKLKHNKIIRILANIRKCPYLPNFVCWHNLKKTKCFAVVTEFINGEDVDEYCDGNKKRVRRVMSDISKAVEFLHDHNIIHRDIKPGNILWNGKRAILIDFDLSTFFDKYRLHRYDLGTQGYKAPEVGKTVGYGMSIDIYSLGMTFASLLLNLSDRDITENKPRMTARKIRKLAKKRKTNDFHLLFHMIQYKPSNRINIKQVLAHNYFNK